MIKFIIKWFDLRTCWNYVVGLFSRLSISERRFRATTIDFKGARPLFHCTATAMLVFVKSS